MTSLHRQWTYGTLAVLGLILPWYFNLQFMAANEAGDLRAFVTACFANLAAGSLTMDATVASVAFVGVVARGGEAAEYATSMGLHRAHPDRRVRLCLSTVSAHARASLAGAVDRRTGRVVNQPTKSAPTLRLTRCMASRRSPDWRWPDSDP